MGYDDFLTDRQRAQCLAIAVVVLLCLPVVVLLWGWVRFIDPKAGLLTGFVAGVWFGMVFVIGARMLERVSEGATLDELEGEMDARKRARELQRLLTEDEE